MAQPVNLAIPVTAGVGLVAQVKVAPAGVVKVSVTELVSVVVVFPAASWMVTTGWVARAVSLVAAALAAVVNASLAGAPAVMVMLLLTVEVSDPSVALSLQVPALSMAQPVNLAIPVTAGVGLVAQVKVAPAGVVKVSVTELVLVVVFPAASWMVTTGWVARAVSLVAVALGAVVNASLSGAPAVMVMLLLTVEVSGPSVALSV